MVDGSDLLDARVLLELTDELRTARDRVEDARVTESQRWRWRRAIAGIATTAPGDLGDAVTQLRRLEESLDRVGA